jgi:hypothetical protein
MSFLKVLSSITTIFFLGQILPIPLAIANSDARIEQVQFARGANSTVIKGQLKGHQFVDYRLRAGAGQTLAVTLKPTNPQNYFNINPPASDASMFIGSTSGNTFKGVLPTDGEYTIRAYLMRPAAQREESSNYTLNISITGQSLPPISSKIDAVIPGTPYHASATIPCQNSLDTNVKQCEAFVIRRGRDATATVEIRWPNWKRRILFVKGKAIASDAPATLSTVTKNGIYTVSLDNGERFEIPDILLIGG